MKYLALKPSRAYSWVILTKAFVLLYMQEKDRNFSKKADCFELFMLFNFQQKHSYLHQINQQNATKERETI